jgi:xanthine/CO dehydrogenase XdhC/CoxF family maturation factor
VTTVHYGSTDLLCDRWAPRPRVLLVGAVPIAEAIRRQAELLGWEAHIVGRCDDASVALEELRASEAVIVLTHEPGIDVPVLRAALDRRLSYVGAMSSRDTQAHHRGLGLEPPRASASAPRVPLMSFQGAAGDKSPGRGTRLHH